MYVLMWILPENVLLVILLPVVPHDISGSYVLRNLPVNFPNTRVWVFPDNIGLHFSISYSSVNRINILQSLYRIASIANANSGSFVSDLQGKSNITVLCLEKSE